MNEKGQSLFEVVVALAVITLIIVAIVNLATNSIRNSDFSRDKTLATRYSQQALEWLRGQRDSDFTTFSNNALTTIWCFSTLAWNSVGPCGTSQVISGTIFRREGYFTTNQIGGKTVIQATIRVYWSDAAGDHEVRSSTDLTDWRQQ